MWVDMNTFGCMIRLFIYYFIARNGHCAFSDIYFLIWGKKYVQYLKNEEKIKKTSSVYYKYLKYYNNYGKKLVMERVR